MSGRFSYESAVFFDEFDPNGHLHNARFPVHVERATTAAFGAGGFDVEVVHARDADLVYVVRQFNIQFLAPVSTVGPITIDLELVRLGRSSADWRFEICEKGRTSPNAHGTRSLVKIDSSGRPTPWSDRMLAFTIDATSSRLA